MVFLFSFSGAFYLALRGEESSTIVACTNSTGCNLNVTNQTVSFNTSLDLYPFETA